MKTEKNPGSANTRLANVHEGGHQKQESRRHVKHPPVQFPVNGDSSNQSNADCWWKKMTMPGKEQSWIPGHD